MLTIVNGMGRYKGFTLIEIVVALAIVSILVMIAVPNFSGLMTKGRRPDGKAILLDIGDKQEMFFTANLPNSYADDLTDLNYVSPQPSEQGYYQVTLAVTPVGCAPSTANPCTGFVLTATALGGQAADGCGNLTLNNFGVKGRSGSEALSACW